MTQSILVLTEADQEGLRKVSREAIGLGKSLADAQGLELVALIFSDSREQAEQALQSGAGRAICLSTAQSEAGSGEALAAFAAQAVETSVPELIIAGASSQGRELGSRLAARLGASLAQDVMSCEIQKNGVCTVTRPMYGGRIVATLTLSGAPKIISIRPNAFPGPQPAAAEQGTITSLTPESPPALRLTLVNRVVQQDHLDISEADVIVSGGYGAGEEGFQALEALAEKLHGAVGASRSAVDAGWRPVQDQVGQTGKVVSPKLYLACGISGAIQHVTGIATAKTVVAVNKDPQAPIFAKADLGVVGDLHSILPLMTKALEQHPKEAF